MLQRQGLIMFIILMNNSSQLDENQKLLIDAFKLQNDQIYDESLQKLQKAGNNLIKIIQKIQSSPQFYMKYMQLMKEEREMLSEKDYKEFLAKNQKVLSRNFQKNAYLALLMQQMQEKEIEQPRRKVSAKDEGLVRKMVAQGCTWEEIESKFTKIPREELQLLHQQCSQQVRSKVEQMDIEYK